MDKAQQQELVQKHLTAVTHYSRQAEQLLHSARNRLENHPKADANAYAGIGAGWAQLAHTAALAAQAAAALPVDEPVDEPEDDTNTGD